MLRFRILISAGPTRESLDPVRFISNRSSGKMGYALAEAARAMGHSVILVSGPVSLPPPRNVKLVAVETTRQMRQAIFQEAIKVDLVIMAAAVADYTPVHTATKKIKKREKLLLQLKKTSDILAELGKRKRKGQILVGFAAETDHLQEHALLKLKEKNLDFIVANQVGRPGLGFDADHNAGLLIGKDGSIRPLSRMTKARMARKLLTWLIRKG